MAEEIANGVTHGLGAALSVAALSVLVSLAVIYGDAWRVVSFSIYGATLVFLYLASTFYHSIQHPGAKKVFHVLDHVAIYWLIAGTYTPFMLVNLRGGWGWTLFGVIWGLALAGTAFKALCMGRFRVLTVLPYVGMGWLVVIALKPTLEAVPPGGIVWLGMGGLAYTSGLVFYAWKRLPFNHAVWHLFVLAGSVCHFVAVLFYVLPPQGV